MKNNINFYDVIIIGGGPAGITSSIYLSRANMKILIIEKEVPGGKIIKTSEIENYPGYKSINGPDLAIKLYNQAIDNKVPFIFDEVLKVDKNKNNFIIKTKKKEYNSYAVIVATGTQERKIGVKNEDKLYGKGVSYCAVCDGFLYKNQDIAVVGGGLAAVEEAMYLTKFAKKVYLIHRRQEFRVDNKTLQRVKNNNKIIFILDTILDEIYGEDKVEGIKVKNVKNSKTMEYKVKAVFPYIGAIPLNDFVKHLKVTDKMGYIIKNNKCETTIKGLYAAGDVTNTSLRQIVTATSDGAIAAQYAISYVDSIKNE